MKIAKPKQYHLSAEELTAVKAIELEILIEIDRICKKHGIKYTLDGGTAIGAVRHGGFIPWDDDIDLLLLRPEYEKLCKVLKTDLDRSRFYYQDFRKTEGYRWGHGKVRRKGTVFARLNQEHLPYAQGIFLDLWPYDNVPDSVLLKPLHAFACFMVQKTAYSKVGVTVNKGVVKLVYAALNCVPEKALHGMMRGLIRLSNSKKNAKHVRMLTYSLPKNTYPFGYKREWFENLTEIEFEGHRFPIVRDYNEWLSYKYGDDFMELPAEKDRRIHPVSALKLIEVKEPERLE